MTKNRGKKREKKNERKMDEMLWWINASRQRNVAEGARVSVTLVGGYRNDIRESRVESSDGVEHGTVSLVENLYKYHGVGMEIEMGMGMKQVAQSRAGLYKPSTKKFVFTEQSSSPSKKQPCLKEQLYRHSLHSALYPREYR